MKNILAILLLASLSVSAATKYVWSGATGLGNGTSWADAWTDVDDIAGLSAGDTVLFAKGTYGGKLTFPTSGTEGNPITFQVAPDAPYNGHVYITNATGVSMSKDYVILNGALDAGYNTNGLVNTNLYTITNNIGFHISCTDNSGIVSSAGVGLKILWCEIGPCGSVAHAGNENGILMNGTDPGPVEIGYCWFHDNIYGDTINIAQNDTFPLNDLVIHHCLLYNTGDDFIQAPGGTTIGWCIMRERTASYSSGHTDIFQGWGGGSKRSQGFPDKSWGNFILHHTEIGDVTGGVGHYGSWSLIQFSGKMATNIFVYNNIMCDHHETNATSSAGFGFTQDGFYDTYNPGCTFSNVLLVNNLWNSPAHQAVVWALPQGLPSASGVESTNDDWRLGSGESDTGGRGFVAGSAFTNFHMMNNIAIDMYGYPAQVNSPVISIPYTNHRWFTYLGGSNAFTGQTVGPTSVVSQATYDPAGFDFRNNVVAGTNARVQIMVSNGWSTVEALDAALGYTGNKSTRPNFVNYAVGSAWNFRLAATDTAAKGAGTNLTTLMASLPDFNVDLDGVTRPATGSWDVGPYQSTDTNLLCWLAFETDFPATNRILDWSGNGAEALQYGWAGSTTNWPTRVAGKVGSYAAQFTPYYGSHPFADPSYWVGQFAAITNVGSMTTLTQATFAAWVRFANTGLGNNTSNHNATILDAGYGDRGDWHFGRYYSTTYGQPQFLIVTNVTMGETIQASWPTVARDWWYTNNAWIHLTATVDCSTRTAPRVRLYMDGTNVLDTTYALGEANAVDYLTAHDPSGSAYGPWLAVGCWTHAGTPPLDDPDGYPNNGWLNGALDDLRIYNRVLSGSEIASLAGVSGGTGGGGEPIEPPAPSGNAAFKATRGHADRLIKR